MVSTKDGKFLGQLIYYQLLNRGYAVNRMVHWKEIYSNIDPPFLNISYCDMKWNGILVHVMYNFCCRLCFHLMVLKLLEQNCLKNLARRRESYRHSSKQWSWNVINLKSFWPARIKNWRNWNKNSGKQTDQVPPTPVTFLLEVEPKCIAVKLFHLHD